MVMRKGLPAKLALTDADDTRYDFRNLVVSNADGSPRGGVTAPVGTNLVTGTATMNVSVGAFAAVAVRDGGVILLANDGPVNVLIDAAPVSNSRWDLICARQDDASSTVTTPDADNLAKLYVVKGTAGATPAVPALPAGSVEIGRVLATAGGTNTNAMVISQTDTYTAGAGGVVPFRSKAALDLWTTAQTGQVAKVGASFYQFLSGQWNSFRHAEFTTTANGVTDSALTGAGTVVLDAAMTTDSTITTAINGGVTVNEAGLYAVQWYLNIGAAQTGRTFALIKVGVLEVARVNVAGGENIISVSIPNALVLSPSAVTFQIFKITGGLSNTSGRIRISKIG